MGKNQPKKQTLQINIQKSSGWIFMKVDEMLEKFVIDTNCFWKYILRYLLLLKKKHLPSTHKTLKTSLVMGISSSAMPNNSKSGVGCTASCKAITVKASIKLSKPPIGWAAEHGVSIFVSEVRDWCFMGWANWSGDFLVDTKMKQSEVILLALNLFLFSWKCIQFNGSFPSLNLLD